MFPTLAPPPMGPPPALGPPYSPELINLNQTYNMSGNALTEALLLLSGVYLSIVKPDPGPAKVGLHAILPQTFGPHVSGVTRKFEERQKHRTLMKYGAIPGHLDVSSSLTRSEYAPKQLLDALCNDVFPHNTITIFYLNNAEGLKEFKKSTADYLPRIIASLGLPIISYDTQFSINARPPLSVQLAPTMGQLIDVMFSFLKKYNWTDFSFLCTVSKGCLDEIAAIRTKVEESHRRPVSTVFGSKMFSFNLLSYVNITDGSDKEEVRDKLVYEMDKDTRIILLHAEESEAMYILDVAKEEGLTSKEYVWILTSSSVTINERRVSRSYPLGSFVIGYDSGRDDMAGVVDQAIDIWLQGLNSLIRSPDFNRMDFTTGFSCNGDTGNQTSSGLSFLRWKYGEVLYKHILKSKLAGDIEFDEHGILKGNRFWIKNIKLSGGNTISQERDRTRTQGGVRSGGRQPSRGSTGGRPSGSSVIGRGRDSGNPPRPPNLGRDRGRGSPPRSSLSGRGRDSGRTLGSSLSDRNRSRESGRSSHGSYLYDRDRDSNRSSVSGRNRDSGRLSGGSSPFGRDRNSGRRQGSSLSGRDRDSRRPVPPNRSSSSLRARDDNIRPSSERGTPERSFNDDSRKGLARETNNRSGSTSSDDKKDRNNVPRKRPSFGRNRSSFFTRDFEDNSGWGKNYPRGGGRNNDPMARGPRDVYNGRRTRKTKRATRPIHVAEKIADWDGKNLVITSITWPGNQSKPPKGKPEKYVLRVATVKEDPHVIVVDPDNTTGECDSHSLKCTVYERDESKKRIGNQTKEVCCTGLCMDLLRRLSEELHIDVNLFESPDGSYGSSDKNETQWTGVIGMVLRSEADLAMGALSITPERSLAVDFSVPFLQTGITIIVAIREGVISPTAFLEPYDYLSWTLILVFSVHATGASIFIFEWLSPYGMDHGKTPLSVHKFSLFRSFWLIWAMLFGASVSTDMPRGCASRFLANIWALFAVVFCASYTANLAAFMITKDDYYDLSGIQDWRLKNPHHRQPPFKFATIAHSATDTNIRINYPEIHSYMNHSAQRDVKMAIRSLKHQDIQAFIYDSTTLEYEVGKDVGCRLKSVGKRIAETGYGVAFPRKSQWTKKFDEALLRLQENGEIERIQKFWLAGACHKKKERVGVSSHTLGILNFTSAFILLGGGIILGALLMTLEHVYFRFGRKSVKKWDRYGCCSLISLSMGQSLTFEQSVMEAIDFHRQHKCKDPLCETQLWKAKHELDLALLKISQLRKQIAHATSTEDDEDPLKALTYDSADASVLQENGTAPRRRRQNRKDGEKQSPASQPLLLADHPNDSEDECKNGRKSITSTPDRRKSSESDMNAYTNPSMYDNFQGNENDGTRPRPKKRSSICKHESPKEADNDGQPAQRSSKEFPAYSGVPIPPPSKPKPNLAELELHQPPPSFVEAMSASPADMPDGTMSPPSPPLPPPPPPPRPGVENDDMDISDLPLPHEPYGNVQGPASLANADKYDPVILDSPELPSSPSFSDNLANRPASPGGISNLSNERISSPDRNSILSDGSASVMKPHSEKTSSAPHDVYSRNPFISSSPQSQQQSDSRPPSSSQPAKNNGDMLITSPREADNDVELRRSRNNDHYVNVDDIVGKETSF